MTTARVTTSKTSLGREGSVLYLYGHIFSNILNNIIQCRSSNIFIGKVFKEIIWLNRIFDSLIKEDKSGIFFSNISPIENYFRYIPSGKYKQSDIMSCLVPATHIWTETDTGSKTKNCLNCKNKMSSLLCFMIDQFEWLFVPRDY